MGQVQVQPPLGEVQLGVGCNAHCEALNLPPYFINDSTIYIPPVNINPPLPPEIWAPVSHELAESIQRFPAKLNQILDDAPNTDELKRNLQEEIRKMNEYDLGSKTDDSQPAFIGIIVALTMCVIGIVCMSLYVWKESLLKYKCVKWLVFWCRKRGGEIPRPAVE